MNNRMRITPFIVRAALTVACALMLSVVPACGSSSSSSSSAGGSSGQAEALSLPSSGGGSSSGETSGAAFEVPKEIVEPDLPPDAQGEPAIDWTQSGDGYVTAQAESAARLKFQVKKGDQTYNYDLPNDGTRTVYPINMGDGSYSFRIMQNTSGSNYVELYSVDTDVMLKSEFKPFLVSNMFCNYSGKSDCVSKVRELVSQATNCAEVVKMVCEYVAANVTYDNPKAAQLATSSGYVPDPDETLKTGKGVCFDYASLSAAMLRSMGIPTKIMTGYVGKDEVYHAWIMVYIDGSWQTVQFKVDPNTWSRCDVTFASTGASQYVGDASAYTDRYTY